MTLADPPLLAAVKARLSDVPGIDQLSLTLIAGRLVFGMGGKIAATQEDATDPVIDAAIRHTFGVQPPSPPAEPSPIPPSAIATAIPQSKGTPTMSITGAAHAGTTLKEMLAQRKQGIADAHAKVSASFDKLDQATTALNTLGDKVGAEADDLLATVGQFTNDLG